jgi:SEC-C motif
MAELGPSDDPRSVELSPKVMGALEEQRKNFRRKFGRDPGPGDPIFFNPDADEPEPMTEEQMNNISAVMEEFGFDEEYRERRQAELEAEGKVHRVGRNDQCPCGSGKKYKHCHGA